MVLCVCNYVGCFGLRWFVRVVLLRVFVDLAASGCFRLGCLVVLFDLAFAGVFEFGCYVLCFYLIVRVPAV